MTVPGKSVHEFLGDVMGFSSFQKTLTATDVKYVHEMAETLK
jgi:hypothetical protein